MNRSFQGCQIRRVAGAETLILGGFEGLFGENGVVFLRKVRWISFHRQRDGDNAGEFKNEGFVGNKIQSGKTLNIGKSVYCLAKDIFGSESEKLLKHSFAHVILIEINRDLVLLVIKVNLYISVAWETVECEKIVNANCKKRYKANRLKLPKVIETMIYLEVANSFKILQRYRI